MTSYKLWGEDPDTGAAVVVAYLDEPVDALDHDLTGWPQYLIEIEAGVRSESHVIAQDGELVGHGVNLGTEVW